MLLVPGSPVPHEAADETSKTISSVKRGTAWRSLDHLFAAAELRRHRCLLTVSLLQLPAQLEG
jgi:hypothetical protein